MEHEVVGHVAEGLVQHADRVANGEADFGEHVFRRVGDVWIVRRGNEQQFVRAAAPVRGDHETVFRFQHDSLVVDTFGVDRRAQDAAALETFEGALFFEDFARHERKAEDLSVRV